MWIDRRRDLAPPPLIELWGHLLEETSSKWPVSLRESDLAWAIESGMAALLADVVEPGQLEEPLEARLRAADRWARIRHVDAYAAALEILDACATGHVPPPTLLKGLSVGSEYYPSPHHRFLGDLDLLVTPDALEATLGVIQHLGFTSGGALSDSPDGTHHHLPPLAHPRTGIWVELHTGLFPARQGLDRDGPFSAPEVMAERRPSDLEGRPVFRLSPELQIVYTASHWAMDFAPAAGARGLLDMLLLLRTEADALDWDHILLWLENRRIAAHLQLMLGCLADWELLEMPAKLRDHWNRVAVLEPGALEVLAGMVERYQLRGAMAGVPDLGAAMRDRDPLHGRATGTRRSRFETLRTALVTRNLRGLLPILDTIPWDVLVEPRPSRSRRLLISWCRAFPPGDPDRFVPAWFGRGRMQPRP
jgi:hypothetical protein